MFKECMIFSNHYNFSKIITTFAPIKPNYKYSKTS